MMTPQETAALQDAMGGLRIVSRLLCAGEAVEAAARNARDVVPAQDEEGTARQDLFAALRTCAAVIFDIAERQEARQEGQPEQQQEAGQKAAPWQQPKAPELWGMLAFVYWRNLQEILRHIETGTLKTGSVASFGDRLNLRRYLESLRGLLDESPFSAPPSKEGGNGPQEIA